MRHVEATDLSDKYLMIDKVKGLALIKKHDPDGCTGTVCSM